MLATSLYTYMQILEIKPHFNICNIDHSSVQNNFPWTKQDSRGQVSWLSA